MEDLTDIFESFLEKAKEYSKTSIELLKLKALEKTSGVISSIISRIAVIIFIFMFFLLGNIGISLWLGEILGKSWYGFLSVAAFYGIVGVVLYFFLHKSLKKLVGNFIIKQILK
jgi:hypothetical protein